MAGLLRLHKPKPVESAWLVDWLSAKGIADDQWVPRAAEEGDWIVLTADKGRESPRLNYLLPAYKVTGIFMGGKIPNLSGYEKIRAVMSVMHMIETAADDTPGRRYRLIRVGQAQRYTLKPWPLPKGHRLTPPPMPPAAPGKLF
jgi:hypothetical protein